MGLTRKQMETVFAAWRALGDALSQATVRLLDAEIMKERRGESEAGNTVRCIHWGDALYTVASIDPQTGHLWLRNAQGECRATAGPEELIVVTTRLDKPGDGFVHRQHPEWGMGVYCLIESRWCYYFPNGSQAEFTRSA